MSDNPIILLGLGLAIGFLIRILYRVFIYVDKKL